MLMPRMEGRLRQVVPNLPHQSKPERFGLKDEEDILVMVIIIHQGRKCKRAK